MYRNEECGHEGETPFSGATSPAFGATDSVRLKVLDSARKCVVVLSC